MSLSSQAQMLGLKYIDTNDLAVERPTSDIHNPKTNTNFVFTAGLNRKISYDLYKNGTLLHSEDSNIITVNDRFAYMGADYYGKIFSTSKISADGAYAIKYSLKDSAGIVVSSGNHNFTIDKTPPTFDNVFASGGYGAAAGYEDVYKLGTAGLGNGYFHVKNINDSSGIDSVTYKLNRADGSVYRESNTTYDQVNNLAALNYEGIFPKTNLDEAFEISFQIKDNAGNITNTPDKTVYFDNTSDSFTPYAVYNPHSNNTPATGLPNYDLYTPGMTVTTNPIKLAYRIPKEKWRTYNPGGMAFTNTLGPTEYVHTDNDYVYFTTQLPYGNTNGNNVRFINYGAWGGSYVSYNLSLSASAPKTPSMTKVEYYTDTKGWINANSVQLIQSYELPITISKMKVSASARTYEQVASHGGYICTIPVNGTSCEAPYTTTLSKGATGYLHGGFSLQSTGVSSPELAATTIWGEVSFNDIHYPDITGTSFDPETRELTVLINQPGRGSYFDRLRLHSTWIEYDGNVLTPSSLSSSGTFYEARFDYTKIPAGNFTITIHAKENHGSETSISLGAFNNDKTAPSILLKDDGDSNFTQIKGLDKLELIIKDASTFTIDHITLSGGPASDVINMASIKQTPTTYSLEYPRIFPALVENEKYTMTIKVTDSFLNTATFSKSFTYIPVDLVNIGDIQTFAVNKPLYTGDNKPITNIVTDVLRDESGSIAYGPQTIYVTLRSDAAFPIIVAGVTISQGETKEIVIDVTNTHGRLNVPVYPAISGIAGKAPFMVSMPVILFYDNNL